MVKMEEGKHAN